MDRKELEAKVIQLVANSYVVDASTLTVDSKFGEDLTGNSTIMVGLVSEIENELDAMVALQEAAGCATIGELVDLVEAEL